ncbi:MAG: hypothetical protein GX481_08990 [Atopobium sp.]|nr:hypothetical protein [Atopobium sp.]
MARLQRTEGFALLELMIAIFAVGVLTAAAAVIPSFEENGYHVFPDQYLRLQTEAMLSSEGRVYEDEFSSDLPPIQFNGNGNVNQARTLTFGSGRKFREIVIELGGGRLVFR